MRLSARDYRRLERRSASRPRTRHHSFSRRASTEGAANSKPEVTLTVEESNGHNTGQSPKEADRDNEKCCKADGAHRFPRNTLAHVQNIIPDLRSLTLTKHAFQGIL